jgi:cytochrome P450
VSDSEVCDVPRYDADLFADAALRDPFPHYRAIRDIGPVVRLAVPDVYAIGRFSDVKAALRAPDILINGRGVGFNDVVNALSDRPRAIQSDGERHRRLRATIARPLVPNELRAQRPLLKAIIAEQVGGLLGAGTFDAVPALARHLPLQAVAHLVGLPEEGRSRMLLWASASFNTLGVLERDGVVSPQIEADLATRREVRAYLDDIDPAELRDGSWAARMFVAVDTGRLTLDEARAAIAAFVLPSLDTTIYAKANLLYSLGRDPDQWARLRADPALIPSAVLEGVRHSAVVRWFSRFAMSDYDAGGVHVPAGARVMVIYGSANRDERHYPDPDRFDVARSPADQLGWGAGPHLCVGLHLAQIEMEVLLEALVERVDRLEVDAPVFGTNRGLYGIDSMPMRLVAA